MFKGLLFFIQFGWKHEKRYILYLFARQIMDSTIPLIAIILPKFIIDELIGAQRIHYLLLYTGILLMTTLLGKILSNTLHWQGFNHRITVSNAFILYMNERTMYVDYADLETSEYIHMREKAKRFLFGNMHGFSYVLDIAVDIIGKVITLAGVIAIVAHLNYIIVLIFIVLILINAGIEAYTRKRQVQYNISLTEIERRWMYINNVTEDFSFGKEVRINRLAPWLIEKLKQHSTESQKIYQKSNRFGIFSGNIAAVASWVQQGIAYAYLIQQVIRSHITIGDFTMYLGGVLAFSDAMSRVLTSIVEVTQFRHYYAAIDTYLNVPFTMRNNERDPLPNPPYTITFDQVSFRYPHCEDYAIRNVSLTLRPGEKLSIVGENGAGKTTFIKLLCRIYDPTEGTIRLNGINIRDIEYDAYMSLFSTVFQDYKLFSFSLYENVTLAGSQHASKEQVAKLLEQAGFTDKLQKLPHGVDTLVYKNFHDEGFEPSGGEGQKIALARAMYKDAPFMIFDEPTSALDPRAEYEMYMNFHQIVSSEKSAVYISHRLASTRFCSQIYVFCQGRIIEQGTHAQLMARQGHYHKLYRMQADFYQD